MPCFSANLTFQFNEVSFLDRFAAAANAGFRAVEFMFPYDHEPAEVRRRADDANVEVVLFNLAPGNWSRGERGIACIPGRESEFRESVAAGLRYAEALKSPLLHAMAGIGSGAGRSDHEASVETYVSNLRYAAEQFGREGITLVIEPINPRDIPGYFLNTQAQAAEICARVGAPNIKLQMDCYHMQVAEGDLSTKLRMYSNRCAHVQVASVPDRHEPDHGEINYDHIFALLDEIGYRGWVGCEYRPATSTVEGLGWFQGWKTRAVAD